MKKVFRLRGDENNSILSASIMMMFFNLAVLLPVVPLAYIASEMMDIFFTGSNEDISVWPSLVISIILILIIFITYRMAYEKKYYNSGREDMRLRMELADKIRKLPLSYLLSRDISDLTSLIMDDVAICANTLANTMTEFISGFASGIIAIIALFFVDIKMALSLAACIPLVMIVMALSRAVSEGTNKKNKNKKLMVSEGLQEYLENIKVLKVSRQMEGYQKGLSKKIKGIIPGLVIYELLAGLTISISYNVMRLGVGIVIITGARELITGEISLFKFLLFLFTSVRIYEPLSRSCEMLGDVIYSIVSANRIGDVLDTPEQTGEELDEPANYDVSFENVTFAYQEENIIKDVSFAAKQGQITALVGPSGCGKSTLTRLAARFWDVKEGRILLGDSDIAEVSPESLLKNYSIVFQDVVLFNDTIFNNIRIGKENASREEVIEAAKLARCDEFIRRLPDGYDTIIGENGKTLSGGERQRLSIARAFLKDAPIILLDESTASIDPENETKIQEAIGSLIQNKTVLVIAHRLRSIAGCDKIVVLEDGRVVEEGTHNELMHHEGPYHRLFSLQNESEGWVAGH